MLIIIKKIFFGIYLLLVVLAAALSVQVSLERGYIGKSLYSNPGHYIEAALAWMFFSSFLILNLSALFYATKKAAPNYYQLLTLGHGQFLLYKIARWQTPWLPGYIGSYMFFGFSYPRDIPKFLKIWLHATRYITMFYFVWFIYLFTMALINE